MAVPDWPALRIVVDDRAAIYAEAFPGVLAAASPEVEAWFTHDEAQDVLYTFAGAWPSLGRDDADASARFLYRSGNGTVCRFRGVELAVGAIVVDDLLEL